MSCSEQEGHPQYSIEGLGTDQSFQPGEFLYRRYLRGHFVDNRLLPSAFQFPRPSFNRAKYSTPEHVLHPDCCDGKLHVGYGVLICAISDLPTPVLGGDNREFRFSAVHRPERCCYAHTEIHCTVEGNEVEQPSKVVKEKFRVALALKMTIHTPAGR